jgi:DedD protein
MEQTLKQRLVGAIILVSLAVIFIPIILEGPDDDWSPRGTNMPEPPRMDYGADMELALPPVETLEVEESEAGESGEPEESIVVAAPAPAQVVAPPAAQPAEHAEPAAPAAQSTTARAPEKTAAEKKTGSLPEPPPGWYIQVGSFSQRMNAEGLRDRLQAAGHTTRIQTINIGKAQVYRVLVGPATSRANAEEKSARLAAQQQIKGIVIEYPG